MGTMIAVAGNLASGKSTIASGLAQLNKWIRLPETDYDATYIDDLFRDPPRWAFEAQLHFLQHKAAAVRRGTALATPSVVDRSLSEEVEVFARYCHERGWIDARAYRLYRQLADVVTASTARPAVLVYCDADPGECSARLERRPRPYQALYPPGHLTRLHGLYEEWWARHGRPGDLRIDTVAHDPRDPAVMRRLAGQVAELAGAVT